MALTLWLWIFFILCSQFVCFDLSMDVRSDTRRFSSEFNADFISSIGKSLVSDSKSGSEIILWLRGCSLVEPFSTLNNLWDIIMVASVLFVSWENGGKYKLTYCSVQEKMLENISQVWCFKLLVWVWILFILLKTENRKQ